MEDRGGCLAGGALAGGVVSYVARPDGSSALFSLGGTLHEVDVESGDSRELASDGNVFDPTYEPGGERVAYVGGRSLRVTNGSNDHLVPATLEDSELVSWGSAEFVAAEEMGRGRGYWWAPEGQRMAVCRVDNAPVEEWWISSPQDPTATPRSIRYPAAGTANADVQLWIVDANDGPQTQIDWRRNEFAYLADVQWGERLLLTVQTRDQRTLAVLAVDHDPTSAPDTCDVHEILRIEDPHWVELQARTPLDSELGLVMIVDGDGPEATRGIEIDGELIGLGGDDNYNYNVRALVGVWEGAIYATVTTDATDSVVARIDPDGSTELLTDVGAFSSATLAGGTLVVTTARPDADTTTEIRWVDGSTSSIGSKASSPGFPCTPTFHVLGDRALNTALCLPAEHDGSPLPVLLDPYGGLRCCHHRRSRHAEPRPGVRA